MSKIINKPLNILSLGRCEYEKALAIQYDILKKRQEGNIEDTLILVEHPPVLTMGRLAKKANIVCSEQLLKSNGIKIFETNRGGDVTYHGPGQIVGYPILDLKKYDMRVKWFVRNIEEVFIRLLMDKYNINASRSNGQIGVWVDNDKITAIGLSVKRGVTMHGFAYNVNTNLDHFNFIIPCGITDKGVTSIEQLVGKTIDIEKEKDAVIEYFCKVFNYNKCIELSREEYL